jgi:hypothetical protein
MSKEAARSTAGSTLNRQQTYAFFLFFYFKMQDRPDGRRDLESIHGAAKAACPRKGG